MAKSVTPAKKNPGDYEILSGADVRKPTHDIKLTDVNGISAGLILCNRNAKKDPRGMTVSSMPRTALQMSQGNAGYDDMLPPFITEVQSTFIGGRGQDTLSTDRTRFADSYRLDTTKEYPICAPKVIAQSGFAAGDIKIFDPYAGTEGKFAMLSYAPSTTITFTGMDMWVHLTNYDPFEYLYYYHYSFVVGDSPPIPNWYPERGGSGYDHHGVIFMLESSEYTGYIELTTTPITVPAGKTLYIIFTTGETYKADWILTEVKTVPMSGGNFYTRSGWGQPWVLKYENTFVDCVIHTSDNYGIKLFEYKRQMYALKNNKEGNGARLLMNGWRGVADVNASPSVLADSTQTGWDNDAAKDCIVLIIGGKGAKASQPWRRVVSSTSGVLNLSSAWEVLPDTTTEYVVLGSNKWFEISTVVGETEYMSKAVTSTAAVKDYMVFAFGDNRYLTYYRVYNNAGTFTQAWAVDATYKADLLCPIVNENGDLKLWRADCDDSWVDCSDVPDWGTPPAFLFDVSAHERADALLRQQRAVVDWDTENAKSNKDAGYLKTLERTILDLDYQISFHAAEGEATGTGPDLVDPEGVTYNTNAAKTAHKYLPMKIYCGNTNARITNIIGYGQPEIPYVLKEDGFGSIYNNVYQKMPIGEMGAVRSEDNGISAMQFGVYLYFNLASGMLERYYDQRLDDIGPNRDEGLPPNRQGEIIKIIPYPGRFYVAIDGGNDGYSSVLCNNMLGWHEIYRTSTIGKRISDIYVQSIPGNQYVDRLWVCEGRDMIAMPISIAPLSQINYQYYGFGDVANSGYVETSWIDCDLKDVEKYFHSVTLFSDYSGEVTTGNEYELNVWFKVDSEKQWTYAGRALASEYIDGKRQTGVKEIELKYYRQPGGSAHNVSGKKIKFKISLTPKKSETETPRLKAVLLNAVLRMPIKRAWNVTFMLEPMEDLQQRRLTDTPKLLYDQLYNWANSKTHSTPLLMRTNNAITDNKYVFIDPASITPFQGVSEMTVAGGQKEYRHVATMTIYEV